ncbi:hypothetical protein L6R53_16200 [Myxococcota bacterium]|nr:hypothetical protein [Myxococcota bacterium]
MSADADALLLVVSRVGAALDRLGVPWMVGGSLATSAYGEPRSTHDVDIVADLVLPQVDPFVDSLDEDFYVDRDTVRTAVRRRGSFNMVHLHTAEKIDVFPVRADAVARAALGRRVRWPVTPSLVLPLASPGDMLVEKLRWYRLGGEVSERQWRDVLGVLRVWGPRLDVEQMRADAAELGVGDLLERAIRSAR